MYRAGRMGVVSPIGLDASDYWSGPRRWALWHRPNLPGASRALKTKGRRWGSVGSSKVLFPDIVGEPVDLGLQEPDEL